MNVYDLTLAAQQQVSSYRSPDIDDWRAAIEPILSAAGECAVGHDKVEDIEISVDAIRIRTSYTVRCCAQSNEMRLPLEILKAENPVKAAERYRINNELLSFRHRLAAAERSVVEYSSQIAILEAKLASVSDL